MQKQLMSGVEASTILGSQAAFLYLGSVQVIDCMSDFISAPST